MKKEFIFYSVVIGFFSVIMYSCVHSLPNANDMAPVCFTSDVLPIFQANCGIAGCHSSGSDLDLTSYPSIMNSITAYDPKNSPAYQAIISKWVNAMPPDKAIPENARTIIRIWIEQGAKENCPN